MKKYTLWFLISTLTLIGCGQTGPLYLPEVESQEKPGKDNNGDQRKVSNTSAQLSQ